MIYNTLNILTFTIYSCAFFILFTFSLKSFIKKDTTKIYASMFLFMGFLLNFIISIYYVIMELLQVRVFTFSSIMIFLGIIGNYFIFLGSAKIKEVLQDKIQLCYRKIFNVFCFIVTISFVSYFIFLITTPSTKEMIDSFIFSDLRIILFYYLTSIFYYLLIIIHLPNFKEYKTIKLGMSFLIINFIFRIFYLYNNTLLVSISIYLSSILFISLLYFPMRSLYCKALHL